ncbi:amino acid adenylation domain-containing protein [Vibrio pectenicida]|uniref:amino acid adenylation domain-containing protein n=1 Tax=Vibrio pectenicida TaxID=62763 RepID=UPI003B9AC037
MNNKTMHSVNINLSAQKELEKSENRLEARVMMHNLPLDFIRKPHSQDFIDQYSNLLAEPMVLGLENLCAELDVSLSTLMLSIFATLVSRNSHDMELLIAALVQQRGSSDSKLEMIPTQIDFSNNPSFIQLVVQVCNELKSDSSDQASDSSFQIGFEYNAETSLSERFTLDLNLSVSESKKGLNLTWFYNSNLFAQKTIASFSDQLNVMLRGIIEQPEQCTSALPLLDKKHRMEILTQWNQTQTDLPLDVCIHSLFEKQVESTPNHIAIRFENEVLTYQKLNFRANLLAHHLIDLGVIPEQLVGICLPRSIDMIVAILAVNKAGGAYVPLDPSYPSERLGYMLENSQSQVLITDKGLSSKHELSVTQNVLIDNPEFWNCLEKISEFGSNPSVDGLSAKNLVYAIYTSGSTGKPKGVMNEHTGLVNRILWGSKAYPICPDDNVLQKTPFGFDVSVWEYYWPLTTGATLVMARPDGHKDVDYLFEVINDAQITVIHFVPPMLASFIADGRFETQAPSLRLVACSGEALPVDVQNRFLAGHQARLLNLYGPTEASIEVSFHFCKPGFDGRSVPIGRPIDNIKLHVLDSDFNPVPTGVVGELYITGVGVTRGYYNREDLTKESFLANPHQQDDTDAIMYRTGDLARWLPQGEVEYLGRIDHQVKIRGFRIELGEIETSIGAIESVSQNVVVAHDNRLGEKQLVAYLVSVSEIDEQNLWFAAIASQLEKTLPQHMIPTSWVYLEALPLTPNGKVDRKALPEPAMPVQASYVAPETETEKWLAELWQDLLQLPKPVGRNVNFFTLGGHSLLAMKMLSLVKTEREVSIGIAQVFVAANLWEFAELVDRAVGTQVEFIPQRKVTDSAPLSFSQQQMWVLDQLQGSAQYNIPLLLNLKGDLNFAALTNAITQIINRHQVLRTVYLLDDTDSAQQIVLNSIEEFELEKVCLKGLADIDKKAALEEVQNELINRDFALAQDLMLRACVVELNENDYHLVIVFHHIAADGWSLSVFEQELRHFYLAEQSDELVPLEELAIQYADFSTWQRAQQQSNLDAQLSYWKNRLAGIPEIHSLPLDLARPTESTFAGARYGVTINAKKLAKFKSVCQQQGATLFMGLQALISALISRYSKEKDIVLGTVSANREQAELSAMIGFFVNTLICRTDLSDDPSFNELIVQCKTRSLEALSNQNMPFERLVEELAPHRSLSHHPLFQIMLVLQNNEQPNYDLNGLVVTSVQPSNVKAKFDLTINAMELGEELVLDWEYSSDLFLAETIQRMASHLVALIDAVVLDPEAKVLSCSMLSENEMQLLTQDWAMGAKQDTKASCMHHLFEQQVVDNPQAIALSYVGNLRSSTMTYEQLNARSNQLAYLLVKQGVKCGDIVGVCIDRSETLFVSLLAILKAGGVYLPLDPNYPVKRLQHMISDSRLKVVVTEQNVSSCLENSEVERLVLDSPEIQSAWLQESKKNPSFINNVDASTPAYTIYTSGLTGKPKGVLLSHHGLVNLAQAQQALLNVGSDSRVLQFASISFDAATWEWVMTLCSGAQLFIYDEECIKSGNTLSGAVEKANITHATLPPALEVDKWRSVKTLVVAGDLCALDLVSVWGENRKFINAYGPTESTICATLGQLSPNEDTIHIGQVIPGAEVLVLDEFMQPVPIGVAGELYIGGEGLAIGYLNQPVLTQEKFVSHPFDNKRKLYRSGDLVRRHTDGNLEFIARIDHQVKCAALGLNLAKLKARYLICLIFEKLSHALEKKAVEKNA